VRQIFFKAFSAGDLPYFHPHSFRDTVVHHGMRLHLTPEAMKALSQNIGHEHVMTTLTSYGHIDTQRQGELIRELGQPAAHQDLLNDPNVISFIAAITRAASTSQKT
jgi:hypothetical protein